MSPLSPLVTSITGKLSTVYIPPRRTEREEQFPDKDETATSESSRLEEARQTDRNRINLQEPWEVDHWTWLLGVSKDELQKVIKKVGNAAEAVRKELGRQPDGYRAWQIHRRSG